MAAAARPSTPIGQSLSALSTPQTGTWRHPRFDEIARRQNARTFTERNFKQLVYNAGGIFALWIGEKFARNNLPSVYYSAEPLQPYASYLYILIRVVLLFNILDALRPLVLRKDDLSDIPLTPAQRRLLGLPPSATPPAPGSQYATPPRYPRSATPQSGSPRSAYSPSPLSGKGSPIQGTSRGSPFSPTASPLLSKAMGGLGGGKRSSYGSPLGPSKGSWLDGPSTPSPSAGKGPSVTLNNKWLWEKGRRSSGDARIFS